MGQNPGGLPIARAIRLQAPSRDLLRDFCIRGQKFRREPPLQCGLQRRLSAPIQRLACPRLHLLLHLRTTVMGRIQNNQ